MPGSKQVSFSLLGSVCVWGHAFNTQAVYNSTLAFTSCFLRVSMLGRSERLRCSQVFPACSAAQSCLTLYDYMDWGLPDSSDHGIILARILEWISSSKGSSRLRIKSASPAAPTWAGQSLYHWAIWEAKSFLRMQITLGTALRLLWTFVFLELPGSFSKSSRDISFPAFPFKLFH